MQSCGGSRNSIFLQISTMLLLYVFDVFQWHVILSVHVSQCYTMSLGCHAGMHWLYRARVRAIPRPGMANTTIGI